MQNDRDRDSGVGIRIIWLMRNATVFLSVFSFCDFFSLNKYSISLPSVLFHSCLGSPIPSLPLPYLQSSFPWPQERFLWEPGKVVYRSWNSPGCWGWGHALPRHQKLCLWVRLLWLLCSQFKAYCPKMLPDRSDRVLWWLLGQDALTHEAAEDPTKAKCQRANADTGGQGKGNGVPSVRVWNFTSWVCLTLRVPASLAGNEVVVADRGEP